MNPSAATPTPARSDHRRNGGDDPVEILARLVGFPTVSRDSNLPLVDWVEECLTEWGATCRRSWSDCGRKANLLATFGPLTEGGIVLSGHTDVVPADEAEWVTDPFRLERREGRLYGRGTTDMKGFIAAALSVAPEMAGATLDRPIHLALSYDEEVGCIGAPRMIADMVEAGLRPEVAIVGEPTGMHLAVAHKSVHLFRTRVRGVEAHSSQPHRGAGAIFAAGRLVDALWHIGEEFRAAGDPASGFDPPWTTVQVGLIEGGSAVNILPGECTFTWEYRGLPSEDQDGVLRAFEAAVAERVLPALREFAPDADIETTAISRVPPLRAEEGGAAEQFVREVLGHPAGAAKVVAYGTEGGQFQNAGISTVVCGPGSIDQAHRPNEYLEEDQLRECVTFLRRVVARAAK